MTSRNSVAVVKYGFQTSYYANISIAFKSLFIHDQKLPIEKWKDQKGNGTKGKICLKGKDRLVRFEVEKTFCVTMCRDVDVSHVCQQKKRKNRFILEFLANGRYLWLVAVDGVLMVGLITACATTIKVRIPP